MVPARSGSSSSRGTSPASIHQCTSASGRCFLSMRRTGNAWMTSPRELGLRMKTFTPAGSLAERQAVGQSLRQPGFHDLPLGGRYVVVEAAQFDRALIHVVNHVACLGIAIARLADGAHVDEIFFAGLGLELRVGAPAHHAVADEGHGHMGVAEETNRGVLVGEA